MRTARRSLVVVLALVVSVFAAPAYAGDDSPGLLETLGNTVDSLTAPILPEPKPAPEPAPSAPTVEQSSPEQPAAPTLGKVVSSTLTGVTDKVAGTLRSTPLAPVVEPVLGLISPKAAPPEVLPDVVAPDVVAPVVLVPEQDLGELLSGLDLLDGSRVPSEDLARLAASADTLVLPGALAPESDGDEVVAAVQTAHIPGTSTLPDGGTSLTTTWLMLWAGVVAAGALIVRRSRRPAART